jgi:pimeloyl-ACP methyl ester carboxylesterase
MRVFLLLVLALLIGVGVYGYAPDVSHAKLVERYGGAPSQYIELSDGSTAHYRDQGNPDGVPIILLHGSSSSLFTWEGWVSLLGSKYRIITVDLPGHGLTGRTPGDNYSFDAFQAFVERFTKAINIDQFVIGGHSMGGEVAARFTLNLPDRVKALILLDASGVTVPDLKREEPLGFTLLRTPVVRAGLRWFTPKSLVKEGLKKFYVDPGRVTEEQIERYWMLIRHEGNRVALIKRYSLPRPVALNDRLGRIGTPTLILWGEEDRLEPVEVGKAYAASITGAEAIYLPAVGHLPQEEAPEKSAAAVMNFLKRFDASIPQAPELGSGR